MSHYLDYAATTPLDERVLVAMMQNSGQIFGNPSSVHQYGQLARRALDVARMQVAALIGADPRELVFVSGGTEADNLALRGVMQAQRAKGDHLIVSAIEHHAILHAAEQLEKEGYAVTVLPVDSEGFCRPEQLAKAMTPKTVLVSMMMANNEVGTILPISDLVTIAHQRGALFHSDAVQAAGLLPIDVRQLGVDLLSLSAHKIYGPKGIGALYVRQGVSLDPMLVGGSQERARRAGTENVLGAIGFGAAAALAVSEREERVQKLASLQANMIKELLKVPGVHLNGPADFSRRLVNNISVVVEGVSGESLLLGLDVEGIAAASGSACTSGSLEPSHVLLSLGLREDLAQGAVRFSLGKDTTEAACADACRAFEKVVARLRQQKVEVSS